LAPFAEIISNEDEMVCAVNLFAILLNMEAFLSVITELQVRFI